jgi:hypothetical protein
MMDFLINPLERQIDESCGNYGTQFLEAQAISQGSLGPTQLRGPWL